MEAFAIGHGRREIIHFGVTRASDIVLDSPTAPEGVSQGYVGDYDADRIHTQLQDSRVGRPTEHRPSPPARIIGSSRVGGLRHRYEWREAA